MSLRPAYFPASLQRAIACLLAGALALLLAAAPAHAAVDLNEPDNYRLAQDIMLRLVNEARVREGVARVGFDAQAAQAAKAHADDMLAHDYFSHWGLDGRKPTRRWNLMGCYDAVAENIYYKKGALGDIDTMLEDAMQTLLASPGHRKTMLNPDYTDVGIGFAMSESGRELLVAQEFVTRLGGAYYCPLYARLGEKIELIGRYDSALFELEAVVLGYEELPSPKKKLWLAKVRSYADAEVRYAALTPVGSGRIYSEYPTSPEVELDKVGGYFKCSPRLDYKKKPGTYYLFVWLRAREMDKPFLAAVATVEVEN
ncbi:CAP domain-containing protein [bacterium]|nr:CAP domain-containing protein [bacterium]